MSSNRFANPATFEKTVETAGGVAGSVYTLTDAATIAVDFSLGNNFEVTIAGDRILGIPTNMTPGQSGFIKVVQGTGAPNTLAFVSAWVADADTAPELAATVEDNFDVLAYYVLSEDKVLISLAAGDVSPVLQISLNDFTSDTNSGHTVTNVEGTLPEAQAQPWRAFDGSIVYYDGTYHTAGWGNTGGAARGAFKYTLPTARVVSLVKLWNRGGYPSTNTTSFKVDGSNDGSSWTPLLAETAVADSSSVQEFTLTTVGNYTQYLFTFYNNTPAVDTINVCINEVQMWG